MPSKYERKCPNRGRWSEESLQAAIRSVAEGMDVNEASRVFSIPPRTLKRRVTSGNSKKGRMGPDSLLGEEAETKMVVHINKLQARGFTPTRTEVRRMAFHLAEQLKIRHKFDRQAELAGYDWLTSFLRRHPELAIRKAEALSRNRSFSMAKNIVTNYFELLASTMEEHQLFDKPACVYNMDETGLQLNNRPGEVIAKKGSKVVSTLTAAERGETITVISCCNSEGTFLPPACILKGKNKKPEFEDGMPPGSIVYMNQKSAYINTEIFLEWLKFHFVPRKTAGKVLLILDGHGSHCSSVEALTYADENDIILLCLPPHTTHYLQPLDRSFFKSLKAAFYQACDTWVKSNVDRKIGRLQFGRLLGVAWGKAASVQNATSGFKAAGIYPFNPQSIPDYAYGGTDVGIQETSAKMLCQEEERITPPQPSTSRAADLADEPVVQTQTSTPPKITPGKALDIVSPIPAAAVLDAKRKGGKLAEILNNAEAIERRKRNQEHKQVKLNKTKGGIKAAKTPVVSKKGKFTAKTVPKGKQKTLKLQVDESSDEDLSLSLHDSSSDLENHDDATCSGCGDEYTKTTKDEDWIQCIHCQQWVHEGCTKYQNTCEICVKVLIKRRVV